MDISFVLRKFRRSIAGFTILALLMSFAGTAFATFSDTDGHWGESYIDELSSQGVVDGYDDGSFGPDDTLTRAQITKFAMNGLAGSDLVTSDYDAGFTDLEDGAWYVDYVNSAAQYGILDGDPDGTFRPNDPVNRAEAAKILTNAAGLSTMTEGGPHFPDVDEDAWYYDYVETAYYYSLVDGYDSGLFGPGDYVTRAQASKMTVVAQDPVERTETTTAEEGDLVVTLSDDTPAGDTIPDKATSVALVTWDFTASGGDASLDDLTVHHYAVSSLPSDHQVYLYEGSDRLTSGTSVNSSSHEATFRNLGLDIDEGDTRSLTLRLDVGDGSSTGEVGFEIESADMVDAGDAEVGGDYPVQGEKFALATDEVGTLTLSKNGTIANPNVGEDSVTIAKFQAAASGEAASLEEIGLLLTGSVNTSEVQNFELYVSGDDDTPLATVDAVDSNDVIRFVIDGGYAIDKGGSKSLYVKADFNSGRNSDSVKVYVDEDTDVLATGDKYGYGLAITRSLYDGNADACASSSSADCSYSALEGGDITITSAGPPAQDIAVNGEEIPLLNFTIVSVSDITFKNFPISLDMSTDSDDTTQGLLSDASGTPPNITDIKIVNTDTGEALLNAVDADVMVTSQGGSTTISETTDAAEAFHLFTDDFEMAAGEELNLAISVDVANEDALDGETIVATLDLGSSYPEVRDINNKTLTNSDSLVPSSSITGKTMTIQSPSLTLSLASTPTSGETEWVKGSEDVTFSGIVFACGDASACRVTDVTLQGYVDDDDGADGFVTDNSGTNSNYLNEFVGSVWLEDADGNELASSKGVQTDSTVQFDSSVLDWTIEAGATEVMYVVGNISSDSFKDDDGENIAFGISSTDNVTVSDDNGNTFTPSGTVNTSQTVYATTLDGGTLTIAVDGSTANEDIVVSGETDVDVAMFSFTSTKEAYVVTDIGINNLQEGITKASDIGEYDNNVARVVLSYENSLGETETSTAYLVEGTATFSGLDFYVPQDDDADLTVMADLNTISSTNATAGEYLNFSIAWDSFEALAQSSGETFKIDKSDATQVETGSGYLDFGSISWTDGDGSLDLDGAQDVSSNSLGESFDLTIDAAGDNTNMLPVGSLICVDDDDSGACTTEDIYTVTAWSSSTSGTEDTVTVYLADDAGDRDYDDDDPLLYALPGQGYLTGTDRLHVYESKPTLALSSSSPSGSRTVSSSDSAFIFTISAYDHDDADSIKMRVGYDGDDENAPDNNGVNSTTTTTGGEYVDGDAGIVYIDTGGDPANGDCSLLDESYASGTLDDYSYVSFWVSSDQASIPYDEFQFVLDTDYDCSDGETNVTYLNDTSDGTTDNTTNLVWVNGTEVSNDALQVGGGTAGQWDLVTVRIADDVLATHLQVGIGTTDQADAFDQNEELYIDGVVIHNEMLVVDIASDADFNTDEQLTATLKEGSTTVATGGVGYYSTSAAKIMFVPSIEIDSGGNDDSEYEVSEGSTSTLTVQLDSGTLLDEDGGEDDPVTFSIDLGSSSEGTVTEGDFWWYETNSTVQWAGDVTDDTLTSNTVQY